MVNRLSWTALKQRFVVGMQLRVIRNTYRGDAVDGQIRTIAKVQTNALMYHVDGKEFWTMFPKSAKDVEITTDKDAINPRFRIHFHAGVPAALHYVEFEIL